MATHQAIHSPSTIYRIEAILADTPVCAVYRARAEDGVVCVVKVAGPGDDVEPAWAATECVRNDARCLVALQGLPVPTVREVFDIDGRPAFAMTYIAGDTLWKRYGESLCTALGAQQVGALDWRDLVSAFVAVCGCLEQIHAVGWVHRDVHSHNLILSPSGAVVVVDFGQGTPIGGFFRFDPSVAPHAAIRRPANVREDIRGVCITLLMLFGGYEAGGWGERSLGRIRWAYPDFPDALVPILQRGTERRYELLEPTISALRDSLAALL